MSENGVRYEAANNNVQDVDRRKLMPVTDDDVRRVFAATLKVPPDTVTPEASPESIAAWDSMGHMRLVTAIETQLEIQLTMEQVVAIDSFAALCRIVAQARNGA
jgi:acyl carrier protein